MNRNEQAHLGALDGLRGIAILLVFWFHVWQLSWLPPTAFIGPLVLDFSAIVRTGFLGVDLFFFLSGFCLYYPHARARFDGSAAPTLAHFIHRRIMKIVPSYLIATAGAFFLGYTHLAWPKDASALLRMHALFFLPSFPSEIASISGVLWSLGVEVQFYVLFPFIAWCLTRQPLLTMLCAAVIATADRMHAAHVTDTAPYLLMEQLPACLDLFVSGMLTAYLFRFLPNRFVRMTPARWAWTLLALGGIITYIATSAWIYTTSRTVMNWPYPAYPAAFPLLDIAFIAATLGSLYGFPAWQRALANPILTFLAHISYNLYLWHQMIAFEMFHHRIPLWHGADPHADTHWQYLFTFCASAAAIAAATAVTYGIEQPLLRLRVKNKNETHNKLGRE